MVAVLEAFDDVIMDRFAVFKLIVLSAPVYAVYHFYSINDMNNFQIALVATAFILINVMLCVIKNVRSGVNFVMPKVFSFQFILFALMSLIGVVPICALLIWCGIKLFSFDILSDISWLRIAYEISVCCILLSIQLSSLMLFAKNQNPLQAYNVVSISKYCVDCFIQSIYALIGMALINAIVIGFIAYLFQLFLSLEHPAFIAICSFAIVYNLSVFAHCLAQIEYQIIPRDESEFII